MLLINFIEAFIFPFFVSHYFDLEDKKKFILLSGLIQFTVLNICSYYNCSGYPLSFFIIFFNIITIYLSIRNVIFSQIITIIVYNFIILITSFVGIYINIILENNMFINFNKEGSLFFACSLAKMLLIVITYFLLKYKNQLNYNLEVKNWKSVLIFQASLVIGIAMVGNSLVTGFVEIKSLIVLLVVLIILNFSFFNIINKINILNEEKIAYQKQLQQEEFTKETLKTIKSIKQEVQAIDHRLFYIIYEIDRLLKNNEFGKIQVILNKYKNIILKHNISVNTGNSVFDCLISLKINDMLANDIVIKTCLFISKDDYYNDLLLINFIIDVMNCLYSSRFVDIELKETNGFLKVGFIFDHTSMDLEKFENYIKKIIPHIKGTYKLLTDQFTELRIGLKLGDYQ